MDLFDQHAYVRKLVINYIKEEESEDGEENLSENDNDQLRKIHSSVNGAKQR